VNIYFRNSLASIALFLLLIPLHAVGQSTQSPSAASTKAPVPNQLVTDSLELQKFQDSTRLLLVKEDFVALDKMADGLRQSKARFAGGAWKLFWFYKAVTKVANRSFASDADWQAHLALLHRWVEARPKSVTARIGLAEVYVDYAWSARGNGTSNTVTDQAEELFRDRGQQAVTTLIDAKKLHSKCPHWYYVMHQAALASGANIAQLRFIFEEATHFEPYYFAYYQQHAIALLPKWFGEEGDSEAFAEEAYHEIGGKEGAHIYFEIALSLSDSDGDFLPSRFSWPKLQEGFSALEELYGLTQYKINRFAFMATQYGDQTVAVKAFAKIGPNWDQGVWGSRARFEAQRSWAGLSPTPDPVERTSTTSIQNTSRNPSGQIGELLDLADQAGNEGRFEDALRSAKAAMKMAEPLPVDKTLLARSYLIVAQNEQRLGHGVEAQKMTDKAISTVSKGIGSESLELAATLVQASIVEQALNDVSRAEELLRRAIAIREKTNGDLDSELPNDVTHLALLCQGRGRDREAIELYQRAISLVEAGGRNGGLISPLEQLGVLYQSMGRNSDAEQLFLRLLRVMEQELGTTSPALQDPLSKLTNLYHSTGDVDKEKAMQDRLNAVRAAK
jgi:tetratricopeptide (TPR) repeat protein